MTEYNVQAAVKQEAVARLNAVASRNLHRVVWVPGVGSLAHGSCANCGIAVFSHWENPGIKVRCYSGK